MSYLKPNSVKENLINKYGQTYGLPLFEGDKGVIKKSHLASPSRKKAIRESHLASPSRKKAIRESHLASPSLVSRMPNWIWDASGVKAEVYNKLKKHFSNSRIKVIEAMLKLGGAATDEEISNLSGLKVSSVNGRRN